jgi:hypothetical protein
VRAHISAGGQLLARPLLFTGIMHTFNITTEAGTRDTLDGPWLKDYLRSVSELRGWSDSDAFMDPYAGHPIEGSVFGFIERQNDPKFRYVQWGDGRKYWISMLRSMAYSAVWHTQWKIGPTSQASIGNVMLHASPGFITLVDTPTLGFCTKLAEDAADRYLIMGLENHTANRPIIILARRFLNPGRTFANVMAFRPPWVRDTRFEIDNLTLKNQLLNDWNNGNGALEHYPRRSAYEFETAQNGPSIAVGGGFDWVVTRPFAWRVLSLEYTRSWMNDVAQIHPQEGLKISTQAVVRIGAW